MNEPGALRTFSITIDVSFAINVILTFFIALRRPDGSLLTNRKTIAKVYIK